MGIDATAPMGTDADYAPPRIPGMDGFLLEPLLREAGWQRPAGDRLTGGDSC
jgi:hypothetical protein